MIFAYRGQPTRPLRATSANLKVVANVFSGLVGQEDVVTELISAAEAARGAGSLSGMTHAWLFTGPPGSGRSVAAQSFAAALQCTQPGLPGCGGCAACASVMHGSHADVRRVIPEGLSIAVSEMRNIVQIASRRPSVGRWQVVIIEDADRLTEGAANALLKVVEEPPTHTVFLLCAPSPDPQDIAVTLRSRCRLVVLRTPGAEAIEAVLRERDGLDAETARWAASVCGGHVGRARRLATDPLARERRAKVLAIAREASRPAAAINAADEILATASDDAKTVGAELNEKETEELKTALGAGGTGRGTAGALRGAAGALKELERRQKSRATRTARDAFDRALMDLAGLYRDALAFSFDASVPATHPDVADTAQQIARDCRPEALLRSIDAILECREALDTNVKPELAITAMLAELSAQMRAA
ncbi:DNA-directed DNA polymerase III subunit delta' [Hoyosella subflava DQS3-9A1]|uniref:DNA polymerase III subunit delta' n=1 Tax=Hoyosella subflava (strain DSM 45089 / JCM 17490 / NBRC 109087 / DQS3-9A1) TaxID=443218 RepID=F6EG53_HOYSD|nr:DNA-directed DNA polymerase III subunit delta' [Hoyosella subflava DQS3-9A1]